MPGSPEIPRPPQSFKRITAGLLILGALSTVAVCVLIFTLGETDPLNPGPRWLRLPYLVTGIFTLNALGLLLLPVFGAEPRTVAEEEPRRANNPSLPLLAVLGLTLVGLCLRIYPLDHYTYMNDELLFIFAAAHESMAESLNDIFTHFHPPTNFLLVRLLLSFSWDPAVIRLPAALGGTLAIPLMYLLTRNLFGAIAGLIAALLVTFSPSLVLLSQVCRNYGPAMPFILASLYFLSRYLQTWHRKHLIGFAGFELAAVLWHYALLPAFLGANLVLFIALVRAQRPWRDSLAAVIWQLPVGIVYLLALFLHLPRTQTGLQEVIVEYMHDEYVLNFRNPFRPVAALLQYLLSGSWGENGLALGLSASVGILIVVLLLLTRRERWKAGFCLSFLPFAYVMAFGAQLLPFGGTRHSFYAFPFVFSLLAALLALLPWGVDGLNPRSRAASLYLVSPLTGGLRPSRVGSGLLLLLLGAYVFMTLNTYSNVTPYYMRQSPTYVEDEPYYRAKFGRVIELPMRTADLDTFRHALLNYTRPGDVILTSMTDLMLFNAHLLDEHTPIYFDHDRTSTIEWKGRRFMYVPLVQGGLYPVHLLVAAAVAMDRYDLKDSQRVAVARGGWTLWGYPPWEMMMNCYPESLGEREPWDASRLTLLPLDTDEVRQITSGVLELGPGWTDGSFPVKVSPSVVKNERPIP